MLAQFSSFLSAFWFRVAVVGLLVGGLVSNLGSWAIWIFFVLVLAFLSFIWINSAKFWFFFASFLLIGALWGQLYGHLVGDSTLASHYNEEIEANGVVVSFPEHRRTSTRVFIWLDTPYNEKILATFAPDTPLAYGETLNLSGKVTKPVNFSGFDYQNHLKKDHVYAIIKNPVYERVNESNLIEKNPKSKLKMAGYEFRQKVKAKLEQILPQPHANVTLGMLIGLKTSLPKSTEENFRRSGLTHLLVVSGANVALVVLLIFFVFRRLGNPISISVALLAIVFYAFVTGGDAPVLRASLMGGLAGLATGLGRQSEAKNALLFALFILLMISPWRIAHDMGLQLSAFATLGLLVLSPPIESYLTKKNMPELPAKLLSTLIAAEIAIIPLALLLFDVSPVFGLLANLLAEPLVPFILLFGFIVSIFGFGFEFLGNLFDFSIILKLIAFPLVVLVDVLLKLTEIFAALPLLTLPSFIIWTLFLLVATLLGVGAILPLSFKNPRPLKPEKP